MDSAKPALGSAGVDDETFIAAFESCRYPPGRFRHLDHVRLAWLYTRRLSPEAAEDRMAHSIRRFAQSIGHEEKFHATITTAWIRLVALANAATPGIEDFDGFVSQHPWLAEKSTIHLFYSQTLLAIAQARQAWVEPDIRPLAVSAEAFSSH